MYILHQHTSWHLVSSHQGGMFILIYSVAARWGAAGFRSRGVRLALQHSLGCGRCCLHLGRWAESGRSFLQSCGGPVSRWGSSPGACYVRRVAAQPYGGWLARGETRQWGKDGFTWWHARTVQMRMREARSQVPHVTSRQDSKYNVRAMSTVHRSPTINPHYPLMFLPLRPIPVIKYRDFRRP